MKLTSITKVIMDTKIMNTSLAVDFMGQQKNDTLKSCLPLITVNTNALNADFCDEYILCDKDFPTADSKYYQATRELNNRIFRLLEANFQYQESKIELEELSEFQSDNQFICRRNNIAQQREKLKIMGLMNELESLYQDVIIWRQLVERYSRPDMVSYGEMKQVEMEEKKKMVLYLQEAFGLKLSESQMGLFIKKVEGPNANTVSLE